MPYFDPKQGNYVAPPSTGDNVRAFLRKYLGDNVGNTPPEQPEYPVADKVWELAKSTSQITRPPTVENAQAMDTNSLGMFDVPGGMSLAAGPLTKKLPHTIAPLVEKLPQVAEDNIFTRAMALQKIKNEKAVISPPRLVDMEELDRLGIKPGMAHLSPDDAESFGIPYKNKDYNYRLQTVSNKKYLTKNGHVVGHIGLNDEDSIKAAFIEEALQGEGLGTEMYRQLFNEGNPISSDDLMAMEPEAKAIWEKLSKEFPGKITKTKKGYKFNP